MEDLITKEFAEFKELTGQLRAAYKSVVAVRGNYRPSIADERYLTGEEVMDYLQICQRTLQTLRNNRTIAFTTIGSKILYPESELQKFLYNNYQSMEPPF